MNDVSTAGPFSSTEQSRVHAGAILPLLEGDDDRAMSEEACERIRQHLGIACTATDYEMLHAGLLAVKADVRQAR